jgi:hypothetical protein
VTVQVAGIIAEVKCLVDTGLREWTQQRLHFRRRKIWVLLPVLKITDPMSLSGCPAHLAMKRPCGLHVAIVGGWGSPKDGWRRQTTLLAVLECVGV